MSENKKLNEIAESEELDGQITLDEYIESENEVVETVAEDHMPHVSECNCKKKKEPAFCTKKEAALMFIVMICVTVVCCFSTFLSLREQTTVLEGKLQDISNKLMMLEAKLELYQQTETDKPINIKIEIDGKGTDYIYNPETGEMIEKEDEEISPETNPNFDKSPFLGIGFAADNAPTPFGVIVDHVYEASPAQISGMKTGDIIMKVDGKEVEKHEDIQAIIAEHKAEDTIKIEIARVKGDAISFITCLPKLTYRGNFDLPTE